MKSPPPNPTADPGGRLGRQLGPQGDWFPAALRTLNTLTNATAAVSPSCLTDNANDTTRCLYASTALKYTKASVFIAQEMPGLWETQCRFEGGAYPSHSGPGIDDVCSGGGGRTGYNCAQCVIPTCMALLAPGRTTNSLTLSVQIFERVRIHRDCQLLQPGPALVRCTGQRQWHFRAARLRCGLSQLLPRCLVFLPISEELHAPVLPEALQWYNTGNQPQ